jgi:hypothetical protein
MIGPGTPCRSDSWNARRARLNHDWLRVKFLTFLQAWRRELDQGGELGQLSEQIRLQLAEWTQRRDGLEDLLASAEDALSPANSEDDMLPTMLSPEERNRIRAATHAEWIQQSGIQERLRFARDSATEIDALVTSLLGGELVSLAGTRLYEAGCRFSDRLSSLSPGDT